LALAVVREEGSFSKSPWRGNSGPCHSPFSGHPNTTPRPSMAWTAGFRCS